jgi:6-pyruvoyltetrahydropterin/6-carboxytetrahydropterin synthase
MHRITRTHEIDAGHRVCNHASKCAHLHGHRYGFAFTCEADAVDGLDALGMVIDFAVIKARLCAWLDEHWDHRMLIWCNDPMLETLRAVDRTVVSLPFNPTAEQLAQHMVDVVGPMQLRHTGVRLVACTVQETAKCSATYEAS